MKKIYISGKITGIEDQAYILFEKAEKQLIEKGYEVVNPMKLVHNHKRDWQSYMKTGIKALMDCDAIYMLKNYHGSKGSIIEWSLAKGLKMEIIYEKDKTIQF